MLTEERKVAPRKTCMTLLAGGPVALGCGTSSSSTPAPSDCPSYMVTIDAGTDAFANVGDYSVCELVTPTQVKCQKLCA